MHSLHIFVSALAIVAAVMASDVGRADETPGEKATATSDSVGRKMNKAGHRLEEAVCQEGDAKCLAKKAKHRVQEGSNYMKDKAKETKDKAD
jgi:hypothetical protein